ncbi:MAG: flagellar biosynthesis protein FlhA, partial [Pseudomonadota bacterium]
HEAAEGCVIVGIVIFLIITTVQFIVITKGSERVAEVAARFTLDALPGRQMSIDSELRAGDITSEEATRRRRRLEKENQFFGAMDGAMKFVKGDAIAGLVIIAINLLGGISIGILNEGMSASEAGSVYSLLTIGDGLVSQLPALIMAICAGTIVTRVTNDRDQDLGSDIMEQLSGRSKSLFIGAILIAGLGFIPGFPTGLFFAMAALLAVSGYFLRKRENTAEAGDGQKAGNITSNPSLTKDEAEKSLTVKQDDVFKITVGSDVFDAFDRDEFLTERERSLAKANLKTGIRLPTFGVELNEEIDPGSLVISLDNVPVFNTELPLGVVVVIADPDLLAVSETQFVPVETTWPMRSAYWVDEADADKLRELGVEVTTLGELLARLGGHLLAGKAAKILGYKLVQEIITDLGKEHEQLAAQVSQTLSPVQLLNVLRHLLEDGVPLAPRRILFEALLEGSLSGGGATQLAEQARFALARQICSNYADENRMIAAYVVEPPMEEAIRQHINFAVEENGFQPDPDLSDRILKEVAERHRKEELNAKPAVIMTQTELRRPLSQFLKEHNLASHVLAFERK